MIGTEITPQKIMLENRKALKITGVKDIDYFSETKVVLNGVLGEILIRGENLHLIGLAAETGDFSLAGKISSISYTSFPTNANFFRRIFR